MPVTSSLLVPTTIISVRNQPFHFRPLFPSSPAARCTLDPPSLAANSKTSISRILSASCDSSPSSPRNPKSNLDIYTRSATSGKTVRNMSKTTASYSSAEHPALARMLAANAQWARDVEQSEPGFFEKISKGQAPQILWIGCSDSRVPESVLLAAKPGELFVTRNVANQYNPTDDSANAVLAYAVDTVGVEHVIIVGHTNCGGAAACLGMAHSSTSPATHAAESDKSESPPANSPLGRWLSPLLSLAKRVHGEYADGKKGDVNVLGKLVEENVKIQVYNLSQSETIVNAWESGKKVYIHGWVFDLERGRLRDLKISQGPPNSEGV